MKMKERYYLRGEIYYADLDNCIGSEQSGRRPVLILQNNIGNIFSPTVIVAPLTRKKKKWLPTHCEIKIDGLKGKSTVLLEQIKTISKERIRDYISKIPEEDMWNVEDAIRVSLGFDILREIDAP